MQRKLTGAAKRAHEKSEAKKSERAKDIARKRQAIVEMQSSHRIVKSLSDLDIVKMKSDAMVHIAYNATKIALYSFPTVIMLILTIKVALFLVNLF